MNSVKISGVHINLDVVSKMTPGKIKDLDIFEDPADYEKLIEKAEAIKAKKADKK